MGYLVKLKGFTFLVNLPDLIGGQLTNDPFLRFTLETVQPEIFSFDKFTTILAMN